MTPDVLIQRSTCIVGRNRVNAQPYAPMPYFYRYSDAI